MPEQWLQTLGRRCGSFCEKDHAHILSPGCHTCCNAHWHGCPQAHSEESSLPRFCVGQSLLVLRHAGTVNNMSKGWPRARPEDFIITRPDLRTEAPSIVGSHSVHPKMMTENFGEGADAAGSVAITSCILFSAQPAAPVEAWQVELGCRPSVGSNSSRTVAGLVESS